MYRRGLSLVCGFCVVRMLHVNNVNSIAIIVFDM